jgi:hypothetical protein
VTPAERYVLLGLALPRAPWFRTMAQWTTAASLPAEFIKVLSAEELRARLASGRQHSAVLVDSHHPGLDRDLVASAREAGVPVFAVGDAKRGPWSAADLAVTATLPADFGRAALMDALSAHCRRIGRGDQSPLTPPDEPFPPWRGRLFGVCGPGGTGASTVAIALAQGYAGDPRSSGRTLLADFALRGEQSMLHDSIDVSPGVQELVEWHRTQRPSSEEIRAMTYVVEGRRYRLLLGLRQPRFWSTVRPMAFDASLDSLRGAFEVVVADIDSDLEGESGGGSMDVQERHHMARSVAARADVVLAVGRPGMKGLHGTVRVIIDLLEHGVAGARILPVFVAAPKHPRARAELAAGMASLVATRPGASQLSSPLFLPERRVDELLRDGVALPAALSDPLVGAVETLVERQLDLAPPVVEPAAVSPGSLGSWADDEFAIGGADPE